jgi:hypothetical protein
VKAYITKNLWGYEQLNSAPKLLDDNFFKFYILSEKEAAGAKCPLSYMFDL